MTKKERVAPINYNIELWDLELGGAFSYQGSVTIDLNIRSPIKSIILNSHQLDIQSANIAGQNVDGRYKLTLIISQCF